MFVLVSTFNEWNATTKTSTVRVNNVYGPYPTKVDAEQAKDRMQFPHPDQVFIRPVHP